MLGCWLGMLAEGGCWLAAVALPPATELVQQRAGWSAAAETVGLRARAGETPAAAADGGGDGGWDSVVGARGRGHHFVVVVLLGARVSGHYCVVARASGHHFVVVASLLGASTSFDLAGFLDATLRHYCHYSGLLDATVPHYCHYLGLFASCADDPCGPFPVHLLDGSGACPVCAGDLVAAQSHRARSRGCVHGGGCPLVCHCPADGFRHCRCEGGVNPEPLLLGSVLSVLGLRYGTSCQGLPVSRQALTVTVRRWSNLRQLKLTLCSHDSSRRVLFQREQRRCGIKAFVLPPTQPRKGLA